MIEIRELQPDDANLMAQIAAKAHTHPMSEQTITSCFGRFYYVLGVFVDQQLCGFIILHQLFEDATVMDICLLPDYQGQGMGRQLMQSALSWLANTEAEQLLLEVRRSNVAAIALYLNLGFIETGCRQGYYRTEHGTEDAILMQLNLLLSAQ
ncbi:ribosomal-protein-alanine acetyltransferase [Shewanella sp. NFH-SH190041]|nr:ribosomal-protein-alanine acetyltransferase [Shewanella sp. NFH-SH190041]